jgi:hypothetical protein
VLGLLEKWVCVIARHGVTTLSGTASEANEPGGKYPPLKWSLTFGRFAAGSER